MFTGRTMPTAAHIASSYAYVEALKRLPCTDCGNTFPTICMDFDHLPLYTKSKAISNAVRKYSFDRLKGEIAKCELVCSNCHRVRTEKRRLAKAARLKLIRQLHK